MSPVPQHRRYYEDATTSRSRIPGHLWFRSQAPHAPPVFVIAEALLIGVEDAHQAWNRDQPAVPVPAFLRMDVSGISQVPWRSIPCLCHAPRPRPSRQNLALAVLTMLSPGNPRRRPQHAIISRLTHGFSIRCLRFTSDVAVAHARLASGWRAAPLPGGRRTLWIASKGFRFYIPFSFPGLALSQGSCIFI